MIRIRKKIIGPCFLCVFMLLMIVGIVSSCTGSRINDIRHQVKVENGLLTGLPGKDSSITVFKGVPYAAPPVGDLRWRPPQPPVKWHGVRHTNEYCSSCIQNVQRRYLPWTEEYMPQNEFSEDCLFLNIWTPATRQEERLPVFVHIPGGGFTSGSGEVLLYNGERLAAKGVVVVTINYRVGLIGFLSHPELTAESPQKSSGNYGLLDQLEALRWIHRNIASFGGDPGKVTVCGQSAGARSVNILTASPMAKGLFQRAIAQSSPYSDRVTLNLLSEAEKNGVRLMDSLKVKSIEELRTIPADSLQLLNNKLNFRFGPVVDGWYLPQDVGVIFSKGQQNDVPLITGITADEGSSSPEYGNLPAEEFRMRMKGEYGKAADQFFRFYPAGNNSEASLSQKQSARDAGLANMYLWAEKRAFTSKTPVFNYYLERVTPWPDYPQYGAFHSSELPYVFRNLHLIDRPWEESDRQLSELISSYWVNFIKTGNPNGHDLPEWPSGKYSMMRFNEKSVADSILGKEKLDFFRNSWKKP
jgi:para-nitrobenzyl esterase